MNEKNKKLYEMYLTSCETLHFETRKTTYKIYQSSMKQFMIFLYEEENDALLISEETLKDITFILENFIVYCRRKGNNNQTINNKLTAISSFYIWCVKKNLIGSHPFLHKFERLRRGDFDKRRESYFLTLEEIMRARILMEQNPKEFNLQIRLLWELFLESGGRISAIQHLKWNQVNYSKGIFENVKEKGLKIVDLIFFEKTERLLRELEIERREKGIKSEYIFISSLDPATFICQATIRTYVRKIGKLIGYEKLYPHTLRKTAINNLMKMIDLTTASEFAHHEDTKTTKDFYTKKEAATQYRNRIMQTMKDRGYE